MATDGGTSDARFIKNYCQVVEVGIVNNTLHKVDENVKIDDIERLQELYFKLFGEEFVNCHNSKYDVKACARCLFECIRNQIIIL